jgi:heme A synthase
MLADARRRGRFALYAWLVLAYNLLVILWGAVVRATGSGAGCGEHWPLCQGVAIPHAAAIATLIEFAHRASSGVSVILVTGLAWFAFRRFPSARRVRRYALAALCLTLTEGLIGAALVLFGWTGNNVSTARFAVLAVHLANTFMLLASLALTARSAGSGVAPEPASAAAGGGWIADKVASSRVLAYGLGLAGTLALAITGTIAALADTLFPVTSLAQGFARDFSATSNYLLRLRIIHPILAVIVGVFLLALAARTLSEPQSPAARRMALYLFGLVLLQVALGGLNLALLAPVPLQVLHLLVADLVWVALVLLAAEVLAASPSVTAQRLEAHSTLTAARSAGPVWNRRA